MCNEILKKSLIVFVLVFAISTNTVKSQEQNEEKKGLYFYSFSISSEIFIMEYAYSAGFAISADISYAANKIVYTFSASIGEEVAIWYQGDSFQQLNLLIGKEFEVTNKFFIDTHIGAGVLFYQTSDRYDYDTKLTFPIKMALPIIAKFRFKIGEKFSIGAKLQANFNSINNLYSAGVLLQWNY